MTSRDAPLKVLVAPLDWGLGHATRCIPIIQELLAQNCIVLIAAEGKNKTLLQAEFPALSFLHLSGYGVKYAVSGWGLALKIVAQIPKIMAAINREQAWLEKVVQTENIDVVISDNRYGLRSKSIRSIFMTHQLLIKAPLSLGEKLLQKINYHHINQFDECWVPDQEGKNNLAGRLSHPQTRPAVPLKYLGTLSRFSYETSGRVGSYLLILLSGPEPQRTLLEKKLLNDLKDYTDPVVLVRGLPNADDYLPVSENVSVFSHLPAEEMEGTIKDASLVISRCGYSTVMDLSILKKKSILIPTPGQTEQEYLARHLFAMNFAFCIAQEKFRLKPALRLVNSFTYRFPDFPPSSLHNVVASLIDDVQKKKTAEASGTNFLND